MQNANQPSKQQLKAKNIKKALKQFIPLMLVTKSLARIMQKKKKIYNCLSEIKGQLLPCVVSLLRYLCDDLAEINLTFRAHLEINLANSSAFKSGTIRAAQLA